MTNEEFQQLVIRKLGNLEQDMGTLKGDVQTLKGDVQTLKGDVQTLKGDVQTLKDDVQTLKVGMARANERLDEVDLNLKEMWRDIGAHDRKFEKLKVL